MKKKFLSILTLAAMCVMVPMSVFAAEVNVKVRCDDEPLPDMYNNGVSVTFDDTKDGPFVIKAPKLEGYVPVDEELSANTADDVGKLEFKYRKLVDYTVKYVDAATGEELADSVTKQGVCGTELKAEPMKIDGYVAQKDQETITLSVDESKNVLTCKYDQKDEDIVLSDTDNKNNKANNTNKNANVKKAPTSSNVAAAATTGVPGEPQTGDESLVVLYGALAMLSLAGAGTFAYKKTR